MGVMALGAGVICMSTGQLYAVMIHYVHIDVALEAEFGRSCQILIFIDRWNGQPSIFWLHNVFLDTMTGAARDMLPVGFSDRRGRRLNFELAGRTGLRHVIHGWDIVDRRMTARAGAVHAGLIHYICIRVKA